MQDKSQGWIARAFWWIVEGIGRLFSGILIWALALILLFEEWGWDYLAALVAWFARLPGLRWIEARIRALPPYAALGIFAIPMLSLLPVKLLALYWLGHGHKLLGIGVIVAAKVAGTAVTARLFMLTRPTLMQLRWFAHLLNQWLAFKDHVLNHVKRSKAWQMAQRARSAIRAAVHQMRERWRR